MAENVATETENPCASTACTWNAAPESENPCASTACTWKDKSNCEKAGCTLHNQLACRWDPANYNFLMGTVQTPPTIIMILSLVMVGLATGNWWNMLIWVWVIIIWPLGLETFVLCRHCPYFTDEGTRLTCWALRYWRKWWKYSPRPLNGIEKFVVVWLLFFLPMFLWPVGWSAYGIYYIAAHYSQFGLVALFGMISMTVATALACGQFFLILWTKACTECVNFSCPFNKVPKKTVDAYLELNPVMKQAWIESGYKLGE